MSERAGVIFVEMETCYVENCPSPHIDHDWYSNWKNIDPRHDGEEHGAINRRVLDVVTGNHPIAFRHWWHSVGSGYTGEQSEYILNPETAKSMCEYELSRVGIDEDGRIYRETSRLETFSLMLGELKHYDLI
jgi:hypothetical protein